MRRRGFTLIELLVVISIIALLMSMLMPALARVKQQAQAVSCQARLKQWALITNMYLQDYDWNLPKGVGGSTNWVGVITPFVQDDELWLCPSATKTREEGGKHPYIANDSQRSGYKGSYGFHDWVSSANAESGMCWMNAQQKKAATIPLLADCARLYLVNPLHEDEPPEYESDVIFGGGIAGGEFKNYVLNRHNGYINALFLDFTVRPVALKKLWQLDWHPNWNPDNEPDPVWPRWMQNLPSK